MDKLGKVEISFEVQMSGNIAFWVDKVQWEAMTKEQQTAKCNEAIDDIDLVLNSGKEIEGEWAVLGGKIIDGETVKTTFVYDPEA